MYNQDSLAQSDFTQSDFSQYDTGGAEYALTAEEEAAVQFLTGGVLIVTLVATLIMLAILIPSMWKIFEKAGRPGWHALIPFYNSWVLFEISGKPGWWSILQLIPIVNIVGLVYFIIAQVELAKRFGKDGGFAVLMIFVPIIGYPILGFGKARYNAAAGSAPRVSDTPYPNNASGSYAAPASQPQPQSMQGQPSQSQPQPQSVQAYPQPQPQSPTQPQQPQSPPRPPSNLVQ